MQKLFVAGTLATTFILTLTIHPAYAQQRNGSGSQLGVFRSSRGRTKAPTANDLNRADMLAQQAAKRRSRRAKAPSGWAHGG